MAHHTKEKGDLAVAKAIADLTLKGYSILLPVSEHLPFDVLGYKDKKSVRFQVKYSTNGEIRSETSWTDRKGKHTKQYVEGDFDYFAMYLPQIDVIVYPSIHFGGAKVRHKPSYSATPFYWYEDFLDLTNNAEKRTYREFGLKVRTPKVIQKQKCAWPSREELCKWLWERPTAHIAKHLGVSDVAVAKWAKKYGINKPPRGYWARQRCERPVSELVDDSDLKPDAN